ncbi:MAG: ABC transporter ATP-binding protein [Lachnospiraceae bacterium]|nr:ABC transporter ATP-binding protein [Lachnospiraceae bacterium]
MFKQLTYIFNRREKVQIVFLFLAAIIGSLLECLGVGVFMPFVNVLMDASAIQDTWYLQLFYEKLHFRSAESFITGLTIAIIAIFVVKNVYLIVEKYAIYRFSYNTQRKISVRLLEAYMSEPYTFHLNKNISVLQRSMQEDANLFATAVIHFMELFIEITVCIALGISLFCISRSMTVIILGLLIICVGIFTAVSKKFAKGFGRECQEYKAKIYQWMNQALGGIKEVKVLNRESFFVTSYQTYYKKYAKGLRISRLLAAIPKYIVEMVSMTGLLIAIIIKLKYGRTDIVTFIPQLSAFAIAAFRLMPSVGRINEHVTNIMYAAPSIELVYNDLKDVERQETGDAEGQEKEEQNREWKFEKELEIKKVCYHYPDVEENVIDHVDFKIRKGQTVALIGESGAGKTTMADIILGLLSPQYGRIKADGVDIFKSIDQWHKNIGYIPQTIYLSDDTIRNNVAFGVFEEEIDENAVIEALKKAQLYEFVEGLIDGMDTIVGDRGVRLSGGQRQRIGIARALYHDPEILVLDEATSALDSDTEAAVMEAVDSLRSEKTMIIIAHRLTTIQNADVIFEIVNGKAEVRAKEQVLGDRKD